MSLTNTQPSDRQFADATAQIARVRQEIGKVIMGQDRVIDQTLITLLSGGHLLLVGVPGLAKTLLVETAAKVLGLSSSRIQCTPDLMPADIIGSEVLEEDESGRRSFRYIRGPVFTQLLMADEINRASPRTQSALLQAMQEKEVSVSGITHPLPRPFHVLATQNPIEQEGTYPLPEAQLDRFLMQVDVDYPAAEDERAIILATTTNRAPALQAEMNAEALIALQALVREMPIGDSVVNAILTLVRGARPGPDAAQEIQDYITWAPGPRGAQALMMTVRAKALLEGRSAPSVDDVAALAVPVLKHRMAVNYKARAAGVTVGDLLRDLAGRL